jgi:hypothetical protein
MTETQLLDQYANTLARRESHRLAAVRDYVAWHEARQEPAFIPAADDVTLLIIQATQ